MTSLIKIPSISLNDVNLRLIIASVHKWNIPCKIDGEYRKQWEVLTREKKTRKKE